MTAPVPEETFTSVISVITRAGYGAVEAGHDYITIGPVSYDKGETVRVKRVSPKYGVCLTKTARADRYENYLQNLEEQINLTRNPDIDTVLEPGETLKAEITGFHGKKGGLINVQNYEIFVGPLECDPGTEIEAEYVGDEYARCLTESVHADDYTSRFDVMTENYDNVSLEVGETYTAVVKIAYDEWAVTIAEDTGIAIQTGDVVPGQKVDVKVTGWGRQSAKGELLKEHTIEHTDQAEPSQINDDAVVEADAVDSLPGDRQESTERGSIEEANLNQLKHAAERQSQQEVPATTTTMEATKYSRSEAVKRYVKARANGICEGCEEPAPFENSDGEPYLHAHHIFELSGGGKDTPKTVIALCPNCHFRVHHGKNGDEYNQELIEKLADIEGVSVEAIRL